MTVHFRKKNARDDGVTFAANMFADQFSTVTFCQYECRCRADHWHAGGSGWVRGASLQTGLRCAACASSGVACLGDAYRAVLLPADVAGVLLCFIMAIVIFKKRKCKVCAPNCTLCI